MVSFMQCSFRYVFELVLDWRGEPPSDQGYTPTGPLSMHFPHGIHDATGIMPT